MPTRGSTYIGRGDYQTSHDKAQAGKAREHKPEDFTLERGLAKAQRLLTASDRTSSELVERLEHDGFSLEVANEVLVHCKRCGLIDDARFARNFVEMKRAQKWGSRKIAEGLARHGVPQEDATAAIEMEEDGSFVLDAEFAEPSSEDPELQRAIAFLRNHPGHGKDLYASSMRRLIARGYSYDIARDACRRTLGMDMQDE